MPAPAALTFVFLLLMFSGGAGSDTIRKPAPLDAVSPGSIPIDVFAPPGMKESSVERICAETDAIWKPAGITFTWHRRTSTDAQGGSSQLRVTIEPGRMSATEKHTTLGWITFTSGEADPFIHVSIAGAEDLLHGAGDFTDTVTSRHGMLIERALGRALSHELGHYLLDSKSHTPRGLMRASWPAHQIFGEERRGFELSTEQRVAAVQRIKSDKREVCDRDSGGSVPDGQEGITVSHDTQWSSSVRASRRSSVSNPSVNRS